MFCNCDDLGFLDFRNLKIKENTKTDEMFRGFGRRFGSIIRLDNCDTYTLSRLLLGTANKGTIPTRNILYIKGYNLPDDIINDRNNWVSATQYKNYKFCFVDDFKIEI
jgi:hypothetical protein